MKYKNYFNHELGSSDIYSKNQIRNMTVADLFKHELPLSYQYNTIGIPDDDELMQSMHTTQYKDSNGHTRWRAGANIGNKTPLMYGTKSTEELLEEERRRAQAQQAQTQSMQSQLGTKAGNSAPVGGMTPKAISSPTLEDSPLIEDKTIQEFGKFADRAISKFKNRKKSGGPISEAIEKEVNSPESVKSESPISNTIEQVLEGGEEEPTVLGIPMSELDLSSIGVGEDSSKGFLGKLGGSLKNLGNGVKDGISNLKEKPAYQKLKAGVQKTAQEYMKLQNGEKEDLSLTLPHQDRRPYELDFGIAPEHSVVMDENIPNVSMDFPEINKGKFFQESLKPTTLRDDPMWEELAYNLQHQPSEEEIERQEAEMQAEIDAKLDKIYGVESRVIQGAPRGSSTYKTSSINSIPNQPVADDEEAKMQAEIDAKLDKIYGVESRVMQGAPRGSSTGAAASFGKDYKKILKDGVPTGGAAGVEDVQTPSELLLKTGISYDPVDEAADKVKDYLHDNSKFYRDYEGLLPEEAMQKFASKFLTHFTGREYYALASELNDDGKPAKKRLRDNDFYKLDDIHNEETRRRIEKNMIQNLKLDPNDPATYEKIKDIDVVVPKQNSTLHKQLKNSENIADYVVKTYDKLKQNPGTYDDTTTTFDRPHGFWNSLFHPVKSTDEGALFSVLNNADISSKVNEDGSMDIYVNDFYDFDFIDPDTQSTQGKTYANINNNAYWQQRAGQLKNYSLSIPLHLTKEEVDKIFAKRK